MRNGGLGWWWYRVTAPRGKKDEYKAKMKPGAAVIALGILAALIAVGVFFLWAQSRMRPQVERLAGSRAHYLAAQAINEAVMDAIARLEITYDDLIHFEKDSTGQITALKTDMVMANKVKAGIHAATLERIDGLAKSDIKIPIGNLMDSDLFAGRGPSITVRLVPVGIVDVAFSNQFSEAGINQTRHQILMDINTEIGVLLPGSSDTQRVNTQVCIAETIIVGAVPEAYAELGKNPVFNASGQ